MKERILHEATILFRARGYNGVSIQDISDKVGIKKTGIFHYFQNKETLIYTVIENYIATYFEELDMIFAKNISCYHKLIEIMENFSLQSCENNQHGFHICLCGKYI